MKYLIGCIIAIILAISISIVKADSGSSNMKYLMNNTQLVSLLNQGEIVDYGVYGVGRWQEPYLVIEQNIEYATTLLFIDIYRTDEPCYGRKRFDEVKQKEKFILPEIMKENDRCESSK